jgi:hypothetical protein
LPGEGREETMVTETEERYYDARRISELIETSLSLERPRPLFGGQEFQLVLSFALAFLPKETVDKVLKECCFLEINSKQPSRHVSGEAMAGRYVIVILTDDIVQKPEKCVSAILCETSHYLSGDAEPDPAPERREAARSMAINWLLEYGRYFPGEQQTIGEIVTELQHP